MSNTVFADTNVFVRLLTLDEPEQAKASITLLQKARAGTVRIVLNVVMVAELVWVLERIYKLDRTIIRRDILALQNTPGLEMEQATLIAQAIDLYATQNIDFGDAYHICWMQARNITTAYTFDQRHFARIPSIEAKLPG